MSSRAFRNNNPGNIRHHSEKTGATYPVVLQFQGEDDGQNYARFPTIPKGCAALVSLLASRYGNETVKAMVNAYAPAADKNDPEQYIRMICKWASVGPEMVINDLPPAKLFELCKAISRFEGWDI